MIRPLTGDGSPPVEGSYPQAVEVTAATRWLYLSGQIPVAPDGSLAADFTGQCDQVWSNIETQLAAAGITTLTPAIASGVSSAVVCAPATVLTGASLTAVTVTLTLAVSVTPPEVTVYVYVSVPLKFAFGV